MRINLRNRRLEKKMSQAELGRLLNKNQRTISALELGFIKGSIDTWDTLETVFGIDQKILRQVDDTTSSAP
jgi:transcriptional regulator with XRE-family HTH domain